MKIPVWTPEMSVEDTKNLAYWERNVLALHFAEGWYNDDVEWSSDAQGLTHPRYGNITGTKPRYDGWRRVLSIAGGSITFHVPDDFDVGTLPQISPNWDGHTTEEKWARMLALRGVQVQR